MSRIMHSRTLPAMAVTALTVGAVAVTAPACLSHPSRQRARVHVIHVHRDKGHDVVVDSDRSATPATPAPESVGDQDIFYGRFFRGGRAVGTDAGVCSVVRLPSTYHCVATNAFAAGQLTGQFMADFASPAPGHFAITGGTRAYRGARGEVTYVAGENGADVTLRFSTP